MYMKKIIVMLLVLAMVLSLAACGKKEEPSGGDNTAAPTTAGSTTETSTPAPTATDEPAKPDTTADDPSKKGEGVMTYAEYAAAALDTQVVVETYVQAKQSWWEDKATVYTQDEDGAYFLYSMACSQEDFEKLVPGTKIKVTGYKSQWSGEVEITDATFEIEEGSFIAAPVDVTAELGTDALIEKQNQLVVFKDLTVEAQADGSAFLYNWDGSGSHDSNSDLYFSVSVNGQTYTFTVESYLTGNDTEVYKAVESLKVGDKIDAEGFLYWYNGVNPHITKITNK